jgi:hypothetical protein
MGAYLQEPTWSVTLVELVVFLALPVRGCCCTQVYKHESKSTTQRTGRPTRSVSRGKEPIWTKTELKKCCKDLGLFKDEADQGRL